MTKIINLRKHKIFNKNNTPKKLNFNNCIKISILILSIVSLFFGVVLYKLSLPFDIGKTLDELLRNKYLLNYNFTVKYLIKIELFFMLLNCFFGTSFLGTTLAFLPPVLKCSLIGYISSCFYSLYKLKGVLFCLICIYPYMSITITSLILSSNESIILSQHIYNVLIKKSTANDITLKLYFIRYLIYIIINIVCAFLNAGIITFILPKLNII